MARPHVYFARYAAARLPVYPHRRWRALRRILVAMFVTLTLAAGAIIAFPAILDPLCDDYEWVGAETARIVRQHACDIHNAILELVDEP